MTTELYNQIRDYLRDLIAGTEWEGHLYAVGGCCRDELMGLPIKDVDMAVNLPCGGIRFAEWLHSQGLTRYAPVTFPTYGTAMLRLREFPGDEIELVQTRREKYTDRNRRNPETVFGSLEEDCMRRDLTINALYYDISRRGFVDITGRGIADIRDKVIRTPADPDITYDDDPLRILRCIRFASRFGWEIEEETFAGMLRNVDRLAIVTKERVNTELDKMLTCRHPSMAVRMMRDSGALRYVVPELADADLSHAMKALEAIPADSVLRMSALLYGIDEEGVKRILRRLKYSNEAIAETGWLARYRDCLDRREPLSDSDLRRLQYECGTRRRFLRLMAVVDADDTARGNAGRVARLLERDEAMERDGSAMYGYRLPVTGRDVMLLRGLTPGPAVKTCLDALLDLAYADPTRPREYFEQQLLSIPI